MADDERPEDQAPEEDEYELRFRELELKSKAIREKTQLPEPPQVNIRRSQLGANSRQPRLGRAMGLALSIGYSFVGPLLAGIFIGILLDGKPGGKWTIVGMFVGTIIAFILLIRLVNRLNEIDK